MAHLYKVGTRVTCDLLYSQAPSKPLAFVVQAQMPPVGTSLQYRIKSETETFQRVVSEHQISAFAPPS